MKRHWLRWVGLILAVEVCLLIAGLCRPCFDVPGNLDRSRPVLIQGEYGDGILLVSQGNKWTYLDRPEQVGKLSAILKRTALPAGANRTREGQLLDTHGRILLDRIDENSVFAYSPKHDLLVWGTPPGAVPYGLHIRHNGNEKFISTWRMNRVQIHPDGAIWLAEDGFQRGIAVLTPEGEFRGWRAFGYPVRFVSKFAEVGNNDLSYVKRIAEGRPYSSLTQDISPNP